MTIHRFYCPVPLPDADHVELPAELAHRVTRVLRLRPGNSVLLFDSRGREVRGRLTAIQPAVTAAIEESLPDVAWEAEVHLYAALIRPNRFEWIIEKGTELGVAAIYPIITTLTQVRTSEFGAERRGRWERIAVEAAEQSGRRTVPYLAEPRTWDQALAHPRGPAFLAWEGERLSGLPLASALPTTETDSLRVFVGPEGGFTDEEVLSARNQGVVTVSLGPTILRAETAAIVAVALARDVLQRRQANQP